MCARMLSSKLNERRNNNAEKIIGKTEKKKSINSINADENMLHTFILINCCECRYLLTKNSFSLSGFYVFLWKQNLS